MLQIIYILLFIHGFLLNICQMSNCLINNSGVPQGSVPQGSVLGPLLFLLYINDLPDQIKHKTILFADDASIIVTTENKLTLEQHKYDIHKTLTLIINWLHNNNLQINLSKTNLMNFNNFKQNNVDIAIDGQLLQNINKTTFLGIILNSHLNWKEHIESVTNKINRFSFALYKLSIMTNKNTAMTAYFAYVESILRYAVMMWGNGTDIVKAFIAQKRYIRSMCGIAPDVSCQPYFIKLKILTLPCIYIFECAVFTKINIGIYTSAGCIRSNTRNPNRLVLEGVPKSCRMQKNCYVMCKNIYNNIPESMKALSINIFKRKLKIWLLEKAFYSVEQYLEYKE